MPSSETGQVIPYNGLDLPCGLDRADGLVGPDGKTRVGTKSASTQILVTSKKGLGMANLPIEEEKDSPFVEMAEQDTIKHRFRMSFNEAVTRGLGLRRGIIRTDSNGNLYKMLSCSVQRQDAGKATLETVEECMNGDTPPDRFEVVPVELGLHIFKHPRYINALLGNGSIPATLYSGALGTDTVGGYGSKTEIVNQMVIRLLQDYMDNTSAPWRNSILKMMRDSFGSNDGAGSQQPPQYDPSLKVGDVTGNYPADSKVAGTDMAKSAACEIIIKYWRGEEVPSLVGFRMVWTQYFWKPPPLNPGGYQEDPITKGGLPDFLWDTQFPPSYESSMDIFHWMAMINPQAYSRSGKPDGNVNISWRRESDQIVRERTFFGCQRSWVGSAIGHWDPQLYTSASAPQVKENYVPPLMEDGSQAWTYVPTT